MELQVGMEPMTLGSPTSPKMAAPFLPGFLMGDPPAPASPQPRTFSLSSPLVDSSAFHRGGSAPQPVVPTPKDKSGAPPVRSIYDDIGTMGSPLSAHKRSFPVLQSPLSTRLSSTPGTGVQQLQQQQMCLSPAQVDPFYSQGESLSSEDQLDPTWVTIFGFPPASASYILLQFAQYGNIIKHKMASPGNWMHLQYQSKLQARKALAKDGKVFGDYIMVGVKPCINKIVMDSSEVVSSPLSASFSSPSIHPSTPRSAIRPRIPSHKNSFGDYQVVTDRQTPRKDDSLISKAKEYIFGW